MGSLKALRSVSVLPKYASGSVESQIEMET